MTRATTRRPTIVSFAGERGGSMAVTGAKGGLEAAISR